MIRRIAGRVRRAAGASLVPLRRAAGRIQPLGSSVARIAAALDAAARLRTRRKPGTVRIGVDVRPFYEPLTGVGWYLAFLLEELSQFKDLEIVPLGEAAITDGGPHLHAPLPRSLPPVGTDLRGLAIPLPALRLARIAYPAAVWLSGCDVFFGANYFLPRPISAVATRRVITVHDLTYKRFPELLQKETLENLERQMLREITRADAILCVSEATRSDLLEFYPADARKVHAVLSGPPPSRPAVELRLELPERYVLFVSTIEPRKNLDLLLGAFERIKDDGYPGDLVVAGRIGWKSEGTLRTIAESRWRDAIVRLDYVDRDQLPWLYRRAEIFVLPSRYEGFGFPILEAMAENTPVIAARNSSLPEVAGDAALLIDGEDPAELAGALARLVADPELRRALTQRGRANLARFSWKRAASETAEVLRRVAGR